MVILFPLIGKNPRGRDAQVKHQNSWDPVRYMHDFSLGIDPARSIDARSLITELEHVVQPNP